VRGRHARTSQGRHVVRFCQALRSVGSLRLKRLVDLRKQAVDPIQRKAPRVVPPSSRYRGDGSSTRGDGGTILVFRFSGPHALESSARGRSWWSEQEPTRRCRETTGGVRGRYTSREGSSSADMKRGRAEGQHPGRRETPPSNQRSASSQDTSRLEDRGCARSGSTEADASE